MTAKDYIESHGLTEATRKAFKSIEDNGNKVKLAQKYGKEDEEAMSRLMTSQLDLSCLYIGYSDACRATGQYIQPKEDFLREAKAI